MKKLLLTFAVLITSSIAFANDQRALALDAASKFSQIGSNQCRDLSSEMTVLKVEQDAEFPDSEIIYLIQAGEKTIEVIVYDNVVISVSQIEIETDQGSED